VTIDVRSARGPRVLTAWRAYPMRLETRRASVNVLLTGVGKVVICIPGTVTSFACLAQDLLRQSALPVLTILHTTP